MHSLGVDPNVVMRQIAHAQGMGDRTERLERQRQPDLRAYFKTPRLRELYEFSIGKARGAGGLVTKKKKDKHRYDQEEFYQHFNMSVTHEACSYVQDTTTLQRDLQCAFGSPQKRVKEVLILRCHNYCY